VFQRPGFSQIKREIAEALKDFMGNDVLQESIRESIWERDLRCLRGKNEWKHLHLDDGEEIQNIRKEAVEEFYGWNALNFSKNMS
jgi:hypothetical protein